MPAVVSSRPCGRITEPVQQRCGSAPLHPTRRDRATSLEREFWCVVDGFVVDATAFIDTHPGGEGASSCTDDAGIGAGPDRFSFSFSRGRNAHFPDTGRRFADGVQPYLRGATPPKSSSRRTGIRHPRTTLLSVLMLLIMHPVRASCPP